MTALVVDADLADVVGDFGCSGRLVLGVADVAQEDLRLRDHAGGRVHARDREGGRMGGWACTQALALGWRFMMARWSWPRSCACARRPAAGRPCRSGTCRWAHEPLGDEGRRAQDEVVADAQGDVAAVSVHVVLLPYAPADVADACFRCSISGERKNARSRRGSSGRSRAST